MLSSPLPFKGGAGGGACLQSQRLTNSPHLNASREGEGLYV
jgi:hypothetical protein